jgi:hypothetical protein
MSTEPYKMQVKILRISHNSIYVDANIDNKKNANEYYNIIQVQIYTNYGDCK